MAHLRCDVGMPHKVGIARPPGRPGTVVARRLGQTDRVHAALAAVRQPRQRAQLVVELPAEDLSGRPRGGRIVSIRVRVRVRARLGRAGAPTRLERDEAQHVARLHGVLTAHLHLERLQVQHARA